MVLQLILASKLIELEQFENQAENFQIARKKNENEAKIKPIPLPSFSNYVFGLGDFGLIVKLIFKGGLIS